MARVALPATKMELDYNRFIELQELELCRYVEPFIIDVSAFVAPATLERVRSELPRYDEFHLVYALTLGTKFSPATFSMELPQFLGHARGAVWSSALRAIDGLPDQHVTAALVAAVRRVYALHPDRRWIGDALSRLEGRLRE